MQIYYSTKFRREYKKLSKKIKLSAEDREKAFRQDPFDKKLGTHKLHGPLKEFWAFNLDAKYRIIFEFADKNTVGDHSIYD